MARQLALLAAVASLLVLCAHGAPMMTRLSLNQVQSDSLCADIADYLPDFCSCTDVPLGAKLACETSILDVDLGLNL